MEKITQRIAAITITMNDSYKIKEWLRWYKEYKNDIAILIIVDNNSTEEYKHLLYSYFPEAKIITLDHNCGCTGAYNTGIKYALSDKTITHIALVGNDIRIKEGGLSKCVELLESDEQLGMVAPIILKADSDLVDDFGCNISNNLTMVPFGIGLHLDEIPISWRYCESVTGGMNVSKRAFYETAVGLQDENLFMYSDEVDMAIRAKKAGVKMAVTKEAVSWHQHINENKTINRRHPYNKYLIARNKIYLANKHFNLLKALFVFFYFMGISVYNIAFLMCKCKFLFIKDQWWQILGALNGITGNMKPNKYSHL